LIKHLSESRERILIAVAWFTNQNISKTLIALKNIEIDIVLDDNKINSNSIAVRDLIANGTSISFVKDLQKNYYQMHNKFCVIDNKMVLTGSYNWSYNANTNDENLALISNKEIATSYNMEFSKIKNKKYNIDRISFSSQEKKELTTEIGDGLVKLLKENLNSLEKGIFYKWTDKKIKNKLRGISERIHNTVKDKVGTMGIYSDLISKYGIEFVYLATEDEKANSRHLYSKEGIDQIEHYLNIDFQLLKIRAIDKIVSGYMDLLKSNESESETKRILKITDFVIKEKLYIHSELKK
jgi:hypothetical protein